jgi:hypothetical protein
VAVVAAATVVAAAVEKMCGDRLTVQKNAIEQIE